jgi:hypothetical protein
MLFSSILMSISISILHILISLNPSATWWWEDSSARVVAYRVCEIWRLDSLIVGGFSHWRKNHPVINGALAVGTNPRTLIAEDPERFHSQRLLTHFYH